jgi:chromosome segregation ATPase
MPLFFLDGCGPRVEVATKKFLDKIDDALGKMDVQKAEIDAGIKAAKQGVDGVRKAKIRAQVQLDQIEEKVKPYEEKMAQCDQTLVKLRDLIKADKPAEIAGKTYSVDELKGIGSKVIQARKDAENQINGFKTARENMQKLVASLNKSQQGYESKIANLQSQIAKLEAEMTAAKALKEASASMGDKDATLTGNLEELEKKIATLSTDVRVTLAGESEPWSVDKTDKAINDVDSFIQASQKPNDVVAEIDKILGPAKK